MNNKKYKLFFLVICLLLCLPSSSITQAVREWVFDGGGDALALDRSGNIYVSGYFMKSGSSYYTIRKLSPDGTQIWENQYDITDVKGFWGHETHLAVDNIGNAYLADLVSPGDDQGDYIIIKYASDGSLGWINYYNGPGPNHDGANGITVDLEGNVYVTGISSIEGNNWDCVTIKYSTDGTQLWLATYNSGGWDGGRAIAVDDKGYVYVTGDATGFQTNDDYITIKYSPDGSQLWASHYNKADDWSAAIAVDNAGNVYVTGYSDVPGSAHGLATIKYSPGGDELWVSRYDYGDYKREPDFNKAAGLAVDDSGNVYVTGRNWANDTQYDYVTIKYSSDGTQKWVRRYNGTGNEDDEAMALTIDDFGCVYVTGRSSGVGGLNGTFDDMVTIKYSSGGTQLWEDRFDGAGHLSYEMGKAIKVDSDQNVYVTGNFTSNPNPVTVKYSQIPVFVNEDNSEIPLQFNLSQNYPNPFNSYTTIEYSLPLSIFVDLTIYDILGNELLSLVNEKQGAGTYKFKLGSNNLSSGLYFYQLRAGEFVKTDKMIVIK